MNDVPVIQHKPAVFGADLVGSPQRLFGSKEIATLKVRGQLYTNWTSVRVEQRVTQAFPVFQFECTEESPMPIQPALLQFVPGDIVQVYVGGAPAVFGYISERHVGYDANNHGVRLIGTGDTIDLTNSMVPVEKLGNMENKSWEQLFHEWSGHLGLKLGTKNIDNTPYESAQALPGETIMAALERYARPRNIVIGSMATGGLLALGEHAGTSTGELTEGRNILRANCVVRDPMVYKRYTTIGQGSGSDKAHGAGQNQQKSILPGTSTRNKQSVTVMDVADTQHGVDRRVKMEHVFCEGSKLEAQITLQGWFKQEGRSEEIWRAGEFYRVHSPSLMLNEVLGCSGCVYEQSDQGTTTTLTMVYPEHMNGIGLASAAREAEQKRMQQRLIDQSDY